jgi:hypothetical protein
MTNQNPEQIARDQIDAQLCAALSRTDANQMKSLEII